MVTPVSNQNICFCSTRSGGTCRIIRARVEFPFTEIKTECHVSHKVLKKVFQKFNLAHKALFLDAFNIVLCLSHYVTGDI